LNFTQLNCEVCLAVLAPHTSQL